jgi:hypothetical protein
MTEQHPPPTADGVPVHPAVRAEPTDFSFPGVVGFGVALAVVLAVVAALLLLVLWAVTPAAPKPPAPPPLVDEPGTSEERWREGRADLGRDEPHSGLPPRPRLEALDDAAFSPADHQPLLRSPTQPEMPDITAEMVKNRRSLPIGYQIAEEEKRLDSVGWVDEAKGIAHIRITDAMKKVSAGLPARSEREAAEYDRAPSRSSSGVQPRGGKP